MDTINKRHKRKVKSKNINLNYFLTSLNGEMVCQKVDEEVLRILALPFLMPHQGKKFL